MIDAKESYGEVFCKGDGLSEAEAQEKCKMAVMNVKEFISAESIEDGRYDAPKDIWYFKFKVIETT